MLLSQSAIRAKEETQATSFFLTATHQKGVNTPAETALQTSVINKGTINTAPSSPLVSGGMALSLQREMVSGAVAVTDHPLTAIVPLHCFTANFHTLAHETSAPMLLLVGSQLGQQSRVTSTPTLVSRIHGALVSI